MTNIDEPSKQDARAISHELLSDCLQRIERGDATGIADLAFFWMGHVADHDPVIELGVVEGLMRHVAQQGNKEARDFLSSTWPDSRPILERRLNRLKQKGA